jgi:hypothetical protein
MLISTSFRILAIAGFAFGNGVAPVRRDASAPSPLEVAANSRLPNIPLPAEINDATKTLLQLMTIWNQAEIDAYHNTIDKIATNATGFTDFKNWNRYLQHQPCCT